ncbi:ATP-binding protein [Serratia marcescens]|uniref:sensor histidine kinase n=1 Tax=Serratia TaxID=613 RepID=UPI00083E872F|nr:MULTISPECIES: sensor histidine kinase [Serratia]AUO01597.1 ATP-binding protein [Serratia marcescens]MBN5246058.1 sensor histidine kinase [Serratia ureilytica]MBN5268623.1 sensor histidine kinase [Serratia ureilytica]ODJ19208.1 histidine kinase [Serratia sp. ISTD04]
MAKLRPRARIIRTIGDKLISGPEAAIIELVKNAYDADSPSVEITISPHTEKNSGLLTIRDFGHGMSHDTILNDWLEPATDSKSKNRTSKSGKRTVLGAKGVGRFASASLGKKIKLTSTAFVSGKYQVTKLNLDWDVFEREKYLEDIDIDISMEVSETPEPTGVLIEVEDLTTVWDKKKLQKLIRELRRLATPQHSTNQFDIFLNLEKFTIHNPPPYNFNGCEVLLEKNRIVDALQNKDIENTSGNKIQPYHMNDESDYRLNGTFDKAGVFRGQFTIIRGDNVPQEISIDSPSYESGELSCGPFEIDIKIFDLEKESIEKLFSRMGLVFSDFGLRGARTLLSEGTGVAIYRSGFRIRPYGEPDNDWLHLESRRVQNPSKRLGHSQVSGSIYVGSEQESNLIERSSREGLETNSAFDRLIKLITNILVIIEQKRFDFRAKAGISRKPEKNIDKARNIASLDTIVKAVSRLSPAEQKPILLRIEKESQALTKTLDEIEEYQKLLESRAALGMVVGQVIHDGRTFLEPIISSAKSIIDNAPYILEKSKKGELVRKYYPTYGQAIQTGAKGLSSLFKSLDPISGRKIGRPIAFELNKVIESSLNLVSEELIENDITVNNFVEGNVILYGYQGDLQHTILNIFKNAIFWLSTHKENIKEICLSVNTNGNMAQLTISNNGPVIDDKDTESIFEAGFTLKSEGHGLGLAIAREACRHSKGELYLSSNYPDTKFTIEFPIEK